MDALQAIKERRSVRSFESRAVPRQIVEDLIDCGRLAATAINLQPWEFVVVQNADRRRELASICEYGRFIADAPVCIVIFCKDGKYYLEDGSAASQNIMVAAHAHGLGTCWVAGDKKDYAEKLRELLNVPAGYKLISLIAVGYSSEKPEKNKRPLTDVLHWEKYGQKTV